MPAVTEPHTPVQAASVEARLRLRVKVRLSRGRLDRRIAAPAPWDATPALALRARQLTRARAVRRGARNLRSLVAYADRYGSRPIVSAVVINRAAVIADRETLLGLAERLESSRPVTPRGMVLIQRLLTDCRSPLCDPAGTGQVGQAIWEIVDALDSEAADAQPWVDYANRAQVSPSRRGELGIPAPR